MAHPGKNGCLGALLALGENTADHQAAEKRQIIDAVLACDKLVHCGDRLECTWLASQLADTMRRQ